MLRNGSITRPYLTDSYMVALHNGYILWYTLSLSLSQLLYFTTLTIIIIKKRQQLVVFLLQ